MDEPFVFLDFEASSLASDSWPIELGMAWVDGQGLLQSCGCLIRPDPRWPEHAWWPTSAAIHGIPRADLDRHGLSSADAADLLLRHVAGHIVVSDNPNFEARWLSTLLQSANRAPDAPIRIADIDAAFAHTLQSAGLDTAWEYLHRHATPHRAEADARRMAQAWMRGRARDASGEPARP